jgi:hypothetical protein
MEKPNDKTPEIPLNIFLHILCVFNTNTPSLHHSSSRSFPAVTDIPITKNLDSHPFLVKDLR